MATISPSMATIAPERAPDVGVNRVARIRHERERQSRNVVCHGGAQSVAILQGDCRGFLLAEVAVEKSVHAILRQRRGRTVEMRLLLGPEVRDGNS